MKNKLDFAFVCYHAGIVFTKEDMLKFAGTFKACINEQGWFTYTVDVWGKRITHYAAGCWGHLGFVDPDVRDRLYRFFGNTWIKYRGGSIVLAAYLVQTDKQLVMDDVIVSEQARKTKGPRTKAPDRP